MDTDDFPCTVGFPFAFKAGELRNYYRGWELLKYNEDVGELHRTDENGNRIKLRFATMLAQNRLMAYALRSTLLRRTQKENLCDAYHFSHN